MLKSTILKLDNYNVVDLYNNNKSLRELENITCSDRATIRRYLMLKGVNIRFSNCSYVNPLHLLESVSGKKFNENIFDCIDTEEKAYWLGFIYADGYISLKTNNFELGLLCCDVGHLHKFNRFMLHKLNNVSYHYKQVGSLIYDSYRWSICNLHLCDTLNSYGCVPNKSLILKFPSENIFKSKNLIRHFIRGYVDGDGCICYTIKNQEFNVLGTKEFLNSMTQYLPDLYRYTIHKHHKDKLSNTYCIQSSGLKSFRILYYLYNNSTIYLQRKYEKYLDFCRLYLELYKLLETKIGESCDANAEVTIEIKKSIVP